MENIKYNKAIKLFKSLKTPNNKLNVLTDILPYERSWNVIGGVRGSGKTTNMLLWGMCLNEEEGIVIQHIRQRDRQLEPKAVKDLFQTVIENHYIEKITKGKYNNIFYRGRRWYYTLIDENGTKIDQSEEPFMVSLAIDKHLDLKSVYNAPRGDLIIFDEFLTTDYYLENEFEQLNDLLSTIIRLRTTAHIYLLGNLIDYYSPYFADMEILDIIQRMEQGEHKIITNQLGTQLHIYVQDPPDKKDRALSNTQYFGWGKLNLTAITGTKGTWAFKSYPKPPKGEYKIFGRRYILMNGKYLCLEIRKYEDKVYLTAFFEPPNDNKKSIIYSVDEEIQYIDTVKYGKGYNDSDKIFFKLIKEHRIYFTDNTAGAFLDNYLRYV